MHQKSFCGWALPGPTWGAYSAPPDLLAGFRGLSKDGGERGMWGREGKGGKGEEGEEKGGNEEKRSGRGR